MSSKDNDYAPVSREAYEAAVDELHLEIGRAVTEWSRVEEFLYDLYVLLLYPPGSPIPMGAFVAFSAIVSFQAKIAFVDALARNSGRPQNPVEKDFILEWKKTKSLLEKANRLRNKVAHGSIICPVLAQNGEVAALPVWVPYYERHSYKMFKLSLGRFNSFSPKFQELTAENIASYRSNFIGCQKSLSDLIDLRSPQAQRY